MGGIIRTNRVIPLAGLPDKYTDLSMQMFTLYQVNTFDVGSIYSSSVWIVAFLYNGTNSPITITDIMEEQFGGINLTGVSISDTVPAKSHMRVLFEVTRYGSSVFYAQVQFDSSCAICPIIAISGTRKAFASESQQPRPIDMSSAMEEAYAYADPVDTFYDTLEFVCSTAEEVVRVVNSDEMLPTPDGDFLPCYFDCTLPETEGSVRGQMQIIVEFLPREAQVWLRETSQSRGSITVMWRQYLGPNIPADAWYPLPLSVTLVESHPTGVTVTALFPDLINIPFPKRIMTTAEIPGGII